MKEDLPIGNNRIEDVRWLCSLSESELDVLVALKKLAIQRTYSILKKKSTGSQNASFINHKSLSNMFDLKMLRDLSYVLMQVVKDRFGAESRVDNSNLLKHEICEEFGEMGVEELMDYVCSDREKEISNLLKRKRSAID